MNFTVLDVQRASCRLIDYWLWNFSNRIYSVILDYKEGKWFDNFKGKVRAITDDIYPWGCTRR